MTNPEPGQPVDPYADLVSALMGLRDREMHGFSPGADPASEPKGEPHEHRCALGAVSVAETISLLLQSLQAHSLPAHDKTAWKFAFEFQGVQCRLRLGKFGLRLSFWLREGESERADGLGHVSKVILNRFRAGSGVAVGE